MVLPRPSPPLVRVEVEVKTRLLGVWTAARLAVAAVGLLLRRADVEPGLNTEADAEAFVRAMHEPGQLVTDEPEPELSPIFDVLAQEWPALYARRERALRAPTQEIRQVFDLLTIDWQCSHCDLVEHADCPGCSCPCGVVAVTA
jgi:hypothetical protein